MHPGDSPREPRVLPWADMLNSVGVLFFGGDDYFVYPGDSPREPRVLLWADMLNPVGVLFFWGDDYFVPGFHPGLKCDTPSGYFLDPKPPS